MAGERKRIDLDKRAYIQSKELSPISNMVRTVIISLSFFVLLTEACEKNWLKHGDFCFLFSHNQVSWAEADEICRDMQGYLAEPMTADMDSFLMKTASATHPKKVFWLGGSDLEVEGSFMWMTSRIPFTYKNWIPGDPNNANAGEDCLLNNWTGQGKWADGDCRWAEYYICQKEDGGDTVVIG